MFKRFFVSAGFFLAATTSVWCQNLQSERNKATVLVEVSREHCPRKHKSAEG